MGLEELVIPEVSNRQRGTEIDLPDGGYGWIIVASCFVLNAFTWGVTASFGVYLSEYISADKFSHSRPLEFGFIGGLNFSCAMLVAPLASYVSRKVGLHTAMLSGCLMQSAGYVSASFASQTWHLYSTQGALIGLGIGFIILPSMPLLSQWFSSRRSIANGISSAGSGVGGAAFTWGTAALIQHLGISWSLRVTGLVSLVVNVIATLLLKERCHRTDSTRQVFAVTLLRRREVVLLLLWAFVSMFGYITLLFSLSDFALAIGLSQQHATDVVGFLNIGTAIGRPIIGLISDQFSRVVTAGMLTFLCGVICFALWLPASSFALVALFTVLCGAILGVFWMTIGPLAAEVAGLENIHSLLSLTWAAIIIPTSCAEVIALYLRQLPSPRVYLYPQLFAGFSYLVAGGFMVALWRVLRSRRTPTQSTAHA